MMTIPQIKLLIADNKIEQASNELLTLAHTNPQAFNQVILLKSQFKDYTQNVNLNLLERNEERAKVVNGLLYIADEIQKNLPPDEVHPPSSAIVLLGQTDILSVLWYNLYGYATENIAVVMDSVHPQSPAYANAAAIAQNLFQQYDLTYDLISLEVLSVQQNHARVKMVLETKSRQDNDNFGDNRSTSFQDLTLDDKGLWKIWGSEMMEIKYLE